MRFKAERATRGCVSRALRYTADFKPLSNLSTARPPVVPSHPSLSPCVLVGRIINRLLIPTRDRVSNLARTPRALPIVFLRNLRYRGIHHRASPGIEAVGDAKNRRRNILSFTTTYATLAGSVTLLESRRSMWVKFTRDDVHRLTTASLRNPVKVGRR